MRARGLILAGMAMLAVAFLAGFTTGRGTDEGPAVKSVHLLNLPDGITEADLAGALNKVNQAIFEAGHHHAGYRLWKVTGEQTGEYAYMWEGNWPSEKGYQAIHELDAYQEAATAAMGNMYEAIRPVQVYNRYVEVPAGFGCPDCEHMHEAEHEHAGDHEHEGH